MQQKIDELLQSLYDVYQEPLRILARSYGIPDKDIDDIVQETFIAFFEHYSLNWTPERKRAMLVRILKNRSNDYHRKKQNQDMISMNSEEFVEDSRLAEKYGRENCLEKIVENETYEAIRKAISKMSKELQETAILHLIEGRPQKEVAEILGISLDACRVRISRARKFLRKELGDGSADS